MADHTSKESGRGIEIVSTIASAVIGQIPSIATVTELYPLSLYQPSIYHGKQLFLVIPLMIGVFATWSVLRWWKAMWVILGLFLVLCGIVYWIYDSFGPLSPLHPINWILSYCICALLVAALTRVILDSLGLIKRG